MPHPDPPFKFAIPDRAPLVFHHAALLAIPQLLRYHGKCASYERNDEMAMATELTRATIEMMLLALLKDAASHAYELAKRAHRRSGGAVRWGQGALYPALYRLREKGMVTAKWEGPATGRKRKVYFLTPKGRQELAARTAEWAAFARATRSILNR